MAELALDALFRRDDIRAKYPDPLDEAVAHNVGLCLGRALAPGLASPRIAVGWDARLSSPSLAAALVQGVRASAAQPVVLGLCATELVYFAAGAGHADAGVMVTASHNPKDENGFKFVKAEARPAGADDLARLQAELTRAPARGCAAAPCPPADRSMDLTSKHADYVLASARAPRTSDTPLRVLVEAGNGVGAVAFAALAERLPWLDVLASNADPDGRFPMLLPNPLDERYLGLACVATRRAGADLGLAFDGDADRVAAIDHTGRALSASETLAVLAEHALAAGHGRLEVAHNLVCSRLVADAIESRGGVARLAPVGHGQIKQRLWGPALGACVVAGEHSGHFYFRDFFRSDSGLLAALIVVMAAQREKAAGRNLSDRVAGWRARYHMRPEVNFRFDGPGGARREMQAAVSRVSDRYAGLGRQRRDFAPGDPIEPYAGVDTLFLSFDEPFGEWWFCLRPSGNEPLLRLTAEVVLRPDRVDIDDGPGLLEERVAQIVRVCGLTPG